MTASLSRQALIEHERTVLRYVTENAVQRDDLTSSEAIPDWLGVVASALIAARPAALLDAPQGGDEARLTEGERAMLVKALHDAETTGGFWGEHPECQEFADVVTPTVERILSDRLAASRDQAPDTLAERMRKFAAELEIHDRYPRIGGLACHGCDWQSWDSDDTYEQHVARALLADQPDATASEEDQ